MFSVGDSVCYPMHGIGVIESISEQLVLGECMQYYHIKFQMGRMTAMVPVKTAESVGLRHLENADTCNQVIDFLLNDSFSQENENWNQRYRDNLDKLKGGNIFQVADVVKCLMRRDKCRGLSAGERKMFLTARQVLISELASATGRNEAELLKLVGD